MEGFAKIKQHYYEIIEIKTFTFWNELEILYNLWSCFSCKVFFIKVVYLWFILICIQIVSFFQFFLIENVVSEEQVGRRKGKFCVVYIFEYHTDHL
jgi:hypothetical protein